LGKAEIRRQRIINAAAEVFSEKGYAESTLAEIAAKADTQAGSLYYYFNSREALVEEVLNFSTERLFERVNDALAALPQSATALDRLVAVIRRQTLSNLDRDRFSVAYQKLHDQVPAEMRERIAWKPRAYARFFQGLIMEAREAGYLRADFDPRLMRLLLIGSMAWITDWYTPSGPCTPDEIADAVVELFLNGAHKPGMRIEPRLKAEPVRVGSRPNKA
jgi:AcrR family transcriptional regulator